jgi:hypothetical protein
MIEINDTTGYTKVNEDVATHVLINRSFETTMVDDELLGRLLLEAEITSEMRTAVQMIAEADYDYGNFAENFWNAWGMGLQIVQELGDRIMEESKGKVSIPETRFFFVKTKDEFGSFSGDTSGCHFED